MKNTEMGKQGRGDKTKVQEEQLEVLYQKMGDRWFAFSLIDDEVFVGSIPQSEIDYAETHQIKSEKIVGRS